MGQLNIHLTPDFEEKLRTFMRARGFRSKSEAIRVAVEEGLGRSGRERSARFKEWLGLGERLSANPHPKFSSDHDLWR